jgi:hypothetical protein
MLFGWFRSKGARDRSRLIKKDREHLEARARHFLKSFLKADENAKAQFYRVVEDAVQRCQADAGVGQPSTELEDQQVTRGTSAEAMKILLALENNEAGSNAAFIIDAYATVAIAYHRAAGVYSEDKPMQELGTCQRWQPHIPDSVLTAERGSELVSCVNRTTNNFCNSTAFASLPFNSLNPTRAYHEPTCSVRRIGRDRDSGERCLFGWSRGNSSYYGRDSSVASFERWNISGPNDRWFRLCAGLAKADKLEITHVREAIEAEPVTPTAKPPNETPPQPLSQNSHPEDCEPALA